MPETPFVLRRIFILDRGQPGIVEVRQRTARLEAWPIRRDDSLQ